MRVMVKSALLASVFGMAMAGQVFAGGPVYENGYKPAKDSLGRPDLTGVWDYSSLTAFERPAQYGDRLVMTPQEVAKSEGVAAAAIDLAAQKTPLDATVDTLPPDCSGLAGKVCNYNAGFSTSVDRVMRVAGQPRTSVLTTPDGRVPLNLQGQAPAGRNENAEGSTGRATPGTAFDPPGKNDNPETRMSSERCIKMDSPLIRSGLYNDNIAIQQSRDTVVIEREMIHHALIVRLNAKHRTDGIRPDGGDPIGWYEGNTLVVETTNYSPGDYVYGSWENLKLTERFTRVSPTRLYYSFTVEDPTIWAKPWGGEEEFRTQPNGIFEYACHEGNYGLEAILAGARAEDAKAKSASVSSK